MVMFKGVDNNNFEPGDGSLIASGVGHQLQDDYGVWCNFGKDFRYAYEKGILKEVLPEEEYNEIRFDLLEAGDPRFMHDFYHRIANKIGEFSHLGDGAAWVGLRWNFGEDYWQDTLWVTDPPIEGRWRPNNPHQLIGTRMGFTHHHAHESGGQIGTVINMMMNRDMNNHTHDIFNHNTGLPIEIRQQIIAELFNEPYDPVNRPGIDPPRNFTRMNPLKAKYIKWCLHRGFLIDSLILCNWMYPWHVSPNRDRNYRGDLGLEAKYMTAATGENFTQESLDLLAERMLNLHRAHTVRQMGTIDMFNEHDYGMLARYVFEEDPGVEPFTEGTNKMEREDIQLAFRMLYRECGWCEETGAPTRETLVRLNLGYVADELQRLNLLP
jgi:aldehyde:ferredoxin oxidoreductase